MFRINSLYHIYLDIISHVWVVKYVFISIQYWSSCHYLRSFLHQKRKWVEINVFAMPTSSHGLCWVPFLYLWVVRTPMTLYGDKKFYSSAFCLYCMAWSVKSMVFNSVYTLYYFKHIFMSVEWYLRGAGESLTAIWTLWYIWSILEIVLLLCSAFGVHFEGKHIFLLCEQSDPLFYALCFITHLIQDQYSISKTL